MTLVFFGRKVSKIGHDTGLHEDEALGISDIVPDHHIITGDIIHIPATSQFLLVIPIVFALLASLR